ncbi:MAG: lipid-A-disaccharide synthase [Bacteroidales bacterium]|nr:lipid-A-disaccharide synthase [Bacteroidales bacterium]
MKYYIIAGEASGDLHASNLMRAMKEYDPQAVFRCWGGNLMQTAGGEFVMHYRDLAYMGFAEVALHIRKILANLKFCKKDILLFKPDALILIDYPGFNLRMARFAHKNGLKVIYYISPQVWAWKKSRVYQIRKNVSKMLVVLPFEKDFYRNYDFEVDFVGHPLLDAIEKPSVYQDRDAFIASNQLSGKPIIALLPGSRKQEIKRMLPVMLSLADKFTDYEFVIAGAPSIEMDYYRKLTGTSKLAILANQTHELLRYSHAALVTSGTATLETALFGVPQVVCYKGGRVSYLIARQLVDVKFISLVNLIMDKPVVKELIQHDFNKTNLATELQLILEEKQRQKIMEDYNALRQKLGGHGASQRAAEQIYKFLQAIPSQTHRS